jgi:hypothetical protein
MESKSVAVRSSVYPRQDVQASDAPVSHIPRRLRLIEKMALTHLVFKEQYFVYGGGKIVHH